LIFTKQKFWGQIVNCLKFKDQLCNILEVGHVCVVSFEVVIISDALNETKSILTYYYEFWCTLVYSDTLHIDGQSGFIIQIYCFSLLQYDYGFGASREELSCPKTKISDSLILNGIAAARLDAESLSNGSPTQVKSTSGANGKVWELGGVSNWIINKKSRGSKLNFPNEYCDEGGIGLDNMDIVDNEGDVDNSM
ncbi:hypothetical protein IGI04_040484, partial [Brassica rapa subsp. trilocularis]